jgi:putative hydrolase of the HAD superfamily
VGTLIEPVPPAVEVYHCVGAAFGADLSREEVAKRFRSAFAQAFAHSASTPTDDVRERKQWRQVVSSVFAGTPASLESIFVELWEHFARSESWSLFADVAPAWSELERRGYVLGIASNFDSRLPAVLAGLPPLDSCKHVFWSSKLGYAKPHPQFFRTVVDSLRLPANQILLVGDDWQNDIVGAAQSGWQTLFLDRRRTASERPSITQLTELLPLLACND